MEGLKYMQTSSSSSLKQICNSLNTHCKQNKADAVWTVGFWPDSWEDDQLIKILIEEML